jgi:hypothetical protein
MEAPERAPAPISGNDNIPTFEELTADPEIAALLEFEPVTRQLQKANGWTAAMQRMFIAWLAHYGSAGNAAAELGKARSGIDKIYKAPDADSFRAAWDGAIALFERRLTERLASARSGAGALRAPSVGRAKAGASDFPQPGQVRNEMGEWEDEDSYRQRAEEAKDSIRGKLLRIRRLYLSEISECPGKRAAFEILTELPIDWDAAERRSPARRALQPREPAPVRHGPARRERLVVRRNRLRPRPQGRGARNARPLSRGARAAADRLGPGIRSWAVKDGPRPRGQDGPWPQPLNQPGEQRREGDVESEEYDAAREWLRHVEAGRIG